MTGHSVFYFFFIFLARLWKFSELKPKKAEGKPLSEGKKEAKVMFCQKKKKGAEGGKREDPNGPWRGIFLDRK